jgi:hypothetical protein
MEAGMRWDDTYQGVKNHFKWHDLLDGEGTNEDRLLGYVRQNFTNGEFMACVNDPIGSSKKFNNLEDAKAHIVAYYVAQKLEGT